ncbi:MAG: transcriptional repressor LexA [Clostridia bacterium]|nr:transcriptional repressor LexA [Clostridia bacterium]
MGKIDKKLEILYNYIQNYVETNGFPPTVRDICSDLSIKSTATAHYYLNKLTERGLLNKPTEKKRALSVKAKHEKPITVPLVGTVTAGTPILAVENFEGYYPLPSEFNYDGELFMLKVKGDSMINAGILNGDKIIVKKQQTAENGEIVVCMLDDSATVKRFFKKNGKIIFHPENDSMSDIVVDDASILGVVVGLMRKF